MDISAIAVGELRNWIETNGQPEPKLPNSETRFFSYGPYLFGLNSDSEKSTIKISKDRLDEQILVAQIIEFLKEEDTRIEVQDKELLQEINTLVQDDLLAKELMMKVRPLGATHQAPSLSPKFRQYA